MSNNRNKQYKPSSRKQGKKTNKMAKGINQSLNDDERAISKDFEKGKTSYRKTRNSNDASWYALSPQLLNDAGQLSFNNPIGLPMPGTYANNDPYNGLVSPGVLKFGIIDGIGISQDNSSAVNLAARRMYTFVRHANSGSANYDSPDLMMYMLAVRSAYAIYSHCARAYGVANVYAQKNRYLPDALLMAMGFNPITLRQNMADYRYGLNVLAAKLNSLAVPANMTMFLRSSWMYSNVFKDASTIKSQSYIMVPEYYYLYSETTEGGGSLAAISTPANSISPSGGGANYDTWLGILNTMLAALVESEDIGIMAGDILKAYGSNALLAVPSISEDFVVLPAFDQEVLMQLENSTAYHYIGSKEWGNLGITQNPDTGAILWEPQIVAPDQATANILVDLLHIDQVFNMHVDQPTPADIMVASRLMYAGGLFAQGSNTEILINSCGTELVDKVVVYDMNTTTAGVWKPQPHSMYTMGVFNTLSQAQSLIDSVGYASKFDWHPRIIQATYTAGTSTSPSKTVVTNCFQDWENVTSMPYAVLNKLHETALLSMFNVPSLNGTNFA